MMNETNRHTWKKIGTWTGIGLILLLCLLLLSVLVGRTGLLGYRTYSVASGSMSPTLDVGDVIYVTDGEPMVGDIVVLSVDGQVVTHRIVGEEDGNFITKGDANEYPDTFKDMSITGIVRFHVPLLGHLALAAAGAHLSDRSSTNADIQASSWETSTTTDTTVTEEGAAPGDNVTPTIGELPSGTMADSPESSTTTTTMPSGSVDDRIDAPEDKPVDTTTDTTEGERGSAEEDGAPPLSTPAQ